MDPLMPPQGSILIPFSFSSLDPSFSRFSIHYHNYFPRKGKKRRPPTGNACALIFQLSFSQSRRFINKLLISLILLVYFIHDLLTTLCKPSISCCLKSCLIDLTTDVLGSSLLDDLIQSSSYIRVGSGVSKVA